MIAYGLFAWGLVILTGICSIMFRRLVQSLFSPWDSIQRIEEQPLTPQPSPAELFAKEVKEASDEFTEKIRLIEELPLPPEDRRSLQNEEEEQYAILMRKILKRAKLRGG